MPTPNKPDERLPCGRITGTFGLAGELKVDPTSAGAALFKRGACFFSDPPGRDVSIATVRSHKGRLLVRFADIMTIEAATPLVGGVLHAERSRLEGTLAADEILDVELIGMQLVDSQGKLLGRISRVEHFPSSPMLIVDPGSHLVPFVAAFVRNVDRAARMVTVDVPPGLLDEHFEEA